MRTDLKKILEEKLQMIRLYRQLKELKGLRFSENEIRLLNNLLEQERLLKNCMTTRKEQEIQKQLALTLQVAENHIKRYVMRFNPTKVT